MINLRVEKEERIDSSKLSGFERFKLFLRIQKYVLPLWDKLLMRLLCTQAAGMLILIPPILTIPLMDEILPNGDVAGLFQTVGYSLLAVMIAHVLLFIGGIPTNFSTNWIVPESVIGNYMIAKIGLDLKMKFYRHLQKLSVKFFGSRPIGDHMYRGTGDVDDSALLASESIPLISSTLQRFLMTFALLLSLDKMLVVFLFFYLIIFFSVKQFFISLYRYYDRNWRQEIAQLEATTREILASSKVIKGYGRERMTRRWYGAQVLRMLKMGFRKEVYMYYDMHITGNAFNILLPFFYLYFGMKVFGGTITLGEHIAAGTLMWMTVTPLQELVSLYQLVRQRLVPVERMIETLDVDPDIVDKPNAKKLKNVQGKIELRGVCFGYKDNQKVLNGVSLIANPGEKVALVGEIGAGKSTLTNLLLRLYEPEEGQVLIDGHDIREYTQDSLRENIAIVMQQINTFTESIRQNITYGKPLATHEEVLEAARLACVHEFVEPLPNQYETVLAEGGSLSGGQKQRICLARALIRDPQILVMDEATSALDPITEKGVIEAIDEKYKGRTRLIVAHNLLSAKTADRIYVLEGGRIVETGTHEELMSANGAYTRLWTTELAPEADAS